MKVSVYHSVLRVSLVIVATTLIFDSGLLSPITKKLSDNAITYVASGVVGVLASVPPNELNTLSAELNEREREIAAREALLNEREIQTRDFGIGDIDYSTYVLSTILFMLTVLILFNYYLDWRRVSYLRS